MTERENYLETRVSDLQHALGRALVTLEYVGGCDLIVAELRRCLDGEAGLAATAAHSAGRTATDEEIERSFDAYR